MTIISVTEMWSRQSTAASSSGGRRYTRRYRSAYQVVHSVDATLDEIRTANDGTTAVPRERDLFPNYDNIYCTRVGDIERGLNLSIVPVEYEGEVGIDGQADPVAALPEIDYGSVIVTEEADRDGYGRALTNTVGDPVQGLQARIVDMSLKVRRNYLAVNGPLALQYLNSTNSDTMVVFGDVWQPGQAHLANYSARPTFDKFGQVSYFTVSAEVQFRYPINTVPARAWWHRFRNEGKRARYGTRVSFSGGGGSRAAGYAIASGGAVTGVVMTSRGVGYTSPPAVSFASTTGGSGASGTAVLGTGDFQGQVVSVTIGAGGTGYKSGIQPVVDRNKEPVTEPVLLSADGSVEEDADTAFFCEQPEFPLYLPYNALGLLD